MKSKYYKEVLINDRAEMTEEDFKNTLEHYANLYLKEKLANPKRSVQEIQEKYFQNNDYLLHEDYVKLKEAMEEYREQEIYENK